MITVLLTTICFLMYAVYLWRKKTARINKLTANIPRVKSLPIIGCALTFNIDTYEFLQLIEKTTNELGSIYCVQLGTEILIALSSFKDVEEILSSAKHVEKPYIYRLAVPWVGNGLVTAPADIWRKNRKLISPTFHNKFLQDFVHVFNSNSSILVKILKDEVGEPGFDVSDYICSCTLDIIFETSLGFEVNVQHSKLFNSEGSPIMRLVHEFFYAAVYRHNRPWLYPEILFRLTPIGRKDFKNLKDWNEIIQEAITSRRESRIKEQNLQKGTNESEMTDPGKNRRAAFLDLLLDCVDSGTDWTDYDVRSEVTTMIIAGHDTVTSALSFALYALRDKPDIQDKIFEELTEIFGDSDLDPTFDDLQRMKYLEKVIKEVLRMYPAVPYIGRYMTEDVHLKSGYTVPKGTTAFIFIKHLNYDPDVYPEPEVFNPERFSYENSKGRNPYAYCPFSAGPRFCIGRKFAMLEMKCVLSKIIRNYKILPANQLPDIKIYSDGILRSKTGINITLLNR